MTEYIQIGDAIGWTRSIESGVEATFLADRLVLERGHPHATVRVHINGVEMDNDSINLDKREDRDRLANSVYKLMSGYLSQDEPSKKPAYHESNFRMEMRVFCGGLWEARIRLAAVQGEFIEGTVEHVAIPFVLRPYLLDGGGTIIFGKPGMGKSFIALLMAVCLDAADEIDEAHEIWPIARQRRVLFVNLERSKESLQRRLGSVNAILGLPRNRPLFMLNGRGHSLRDVHGQVLRARDKYHAEFGILDSLSRAGVGDLNDNRDVNTIMDMINTTFPQGWATVAHSPRAADDHIYGGIHFDAAADVVVRLASQQHPDGTLGVGLQITKSNDIGKFAQQIYALSFNPEYGLTGFRPAYRGEFPEVDDSAKPALPLITGTWKQRLEAYMRAHGPADASTAGEGANVSREFASKEFQTAAYEQAGTDGRRRLYRLVEALSNGQTDQLEVPF